MNIREQNLPVTMVREHLENIPEFAIPAGFSLRWYQAGDDEWWTRVQLESERFRPITRELFAQQFGNNEEILRERQCFLLGPSGAIGTATAWFDNDFCGRRFGRVHWVAVIPAEQGRGFGRLLTSIVCHRLRQLGHERAFLRTSTARVAALKLYRSFGFAPLIRNQEEEEIWAELDRSGAFPKLEQ